jgi:hypothetical protein
MTNAAKKHFLQPHELDYIFSIRPPGSEDGTYFLPVANLIIRERSIYKYADTEKELLAQPDSTDIGHTESKLYIHRWRISNH